MDFNKVYNDLRKHGIHLIISQINLHSTTITGTTGSLFNKSIMLSISEHMLSTKINGNTMFFDIHLQINNNIEIEEILIDEIAFNKLYLRVFHEIKQILKQSAIETIKA